MAFPAEGCGRWEGRVRLGLACLIALAAAYTLHRAFVLRIEYADGYQFLMDARALAGDPIAHFGSGRPPFVVLAQLPAVAITSREAPCSLGRLVVPHLVSALLSVTTAAVIFWVYRDPLGTTLAAVGTLLFVATRYFVRYGAHIMADVPAAGWAAAVIGLYCRARARPSPAAYAMASVALGGAVLTKYPLVLLCAALAVAELGYAFHECRLDLRRWVGLGLSGAAAAAFVLAVTTAIVARAFHGAMSEYLAGLLKFWRFTTVFAMVRGESRGDYGGMTVAMVSLPTMLLAGIGLMRAFAERDARDIPFLAWLVVLGGGTIYLALHSEARYLLPAVPAIIYFSARGVGYLLPPAHAECGTRGRLAGRIGAAVAVSLVAWSLANGVHQAVLDRDPVFLEDVQRRAALTLLESRRPGGRLLWLGSMQTFHTRDPAQLLEDEVFDIFHFGSFAAEYFIGERVVPTGPGPDPESLAGIVVDGDAVLRVADRNYWTKTVPPAGIPPLEVWAIRRRLLTRADAERFVAAEDPSVSVRLHETSGRLVITPDENLGEWDLVVAPAPFGPLRPMGRQDLRAGEEISLGPGTKSSIASMTLLRTDRTVF